MQHYRQVALVVPHRVGREGNGGNEAHIHRIQCRMASNLEHHHEVARVMVGMGHASLSHRNESNVERPHSRWGNGIVVCPELLPLHTANNVERSHMPWENDIVEGPGLLSLHHPDEVALAMVEMEHLQGDMGDNPDTSHRTDTPELMQQLPEVVAQAMEIEQMEHLPEEVAPAMVELVNVPHDTLCRQAKHHIRLGSGKAHIVLPPIH